MHQAATQRSGVAPTPPLTQSLTVTVTCITNGGEAVTAEREVTLQ